jgi:serine/threonine protein kinase
MHYHHLEEQIWHRDIKAENILITGGSGSSEFSTAKLCDFG